MRVRFVNFVTINTHGRNTDSPTTSDTSLIFKLLSMFENSITKVGGPEISKFGSIPQFGDFRGIPVFPLQGKICFLFQTILIKSYAVNRVTFAHHQMLINVLS